MSLALAESPAATQAPERVDAATRVGVRWGELGVMFAAWTLVWVFGQTQAYLGSLFGGRAWPGLHVLLWDLESVWLWAVFTPPMFWLA
ncbi:MAG TPA: hypothetical protein VF541_07030, partial [Longimicrobium sp.]